jgi:sulfur relay (sulfurtransferase) complex TusBCD TusD component (DsrE family)
VPEQGALFVSIGSATFSMIPSVRRKAIEDLDVSRRWRQQWLLMSFGTTTALGLRAVPPMEEKMMMMRKLLVVVVTLFALTALPAIADPEGTLFVNLTTDESHRADMAMTFSKGMMERGHPVVIWLNDKGVLIAAQEHAGKFAAQQDTLAALMNDGATVIACPMCMKHYGIEEADLVDGVQVGNPDLTESILFKEGTQTLTW